jgi:protein ImuA
MTAALARAELLNRLRADIARVEAPARPGDALPFGMAEIDQRLHDQGLSRSALHEIAPAAPRLAEDAAATLFAAGIAARLAGETGTVLWAVNRFDLYAPGLEQAGLGPERVLFVEARDDEAVLAVMEDALRHGGPAGVIGEVRRASMTATRRLQLAAAEHASPALLFRRWRKPVSDPLAELSAAATRWRIGCAPSPPLGIAGVGRAHWAVELVRQRGGEPLSLIVEACDAQGRLALPAASADRAAAPGRAAAIAA